MEHEEQELTIFNNLLTQLVPWATGNGNSGTIRKMEKQEKRNDEFWITTGCAWAGAVWGTMAGQECGKQRAEGHWIRGNKPGRNSRINKRACSEE